MPIRLIILDDHPLFRQGIRSVLSPHPEFVIVGEGGSGEELEQLMQAHTPDLISLDLGMPQHAGTSVRATEQPFKALPAIRRLQREYPATQVVVLSQYVHPAIIEAAAEAGVGGYLLKDDELSQTLPDALRAVHAGGVYFSEAIRRLLAEAQRPRPADLTARQIEILQAVVARPERSYAEHAIALSISEHTFRNHLRQLFERLGINSLTAAVVRAIEAGLVMPGPK